MDDGPSWSEPIPRPLRPEPIPRQPQPDPDLGFLPSDLDRSPQGEEFPGSLPIERDNRLARPDPDRQASWPASMPRPSRPESTAGRPPRSAYPDRPTGPGINEDWAPNADSGYDTGPGLGYGPRPYADRGRRPDVEYDPGQATQQSRISGRMQPPHDEYWQPGQTSPSPGPGGSRSSPAQDDWDRGEYGGRPAAEEDPSARLAGGPPGWVTGPQPAYFGDSVPPYAAAPHQADAADAGYSAYSGAVNSEYYNSSENDGEETIGEDTSPLPIVLDMDGAVDEPFHDSQSWPPLREPESAAATWEPQPHSPLRPEPGSPAGNGGHRLDLPAPGQDAAARAKLEQLKDLYLTAEAIGDDALGKHFDELSQRQRSLITEYFSHRGLRPSGPPTPPGDQRPPDGASSAD